MPGLVLEGGALRGVYTDGVLDALLEENILFPYIIGVSAGVSNAYSYASLQKGRNWEIIAKYRSDKRYIGARNYLTERSLFGIDFIYDEIPNRLIPFDYQAFYHYPGTVIAGITDAETGQPLYFDQSYAEPSFQVLRATCALPVLFPPISIQGRPAYDGGLADPIPIAKAIEDNNQKNLIVLTREKEYQKQPPGPSTKAAARLIEKKYPKIAELMRTRHLAYNRTLEQIKALEQEGNAVVLRPDPLVNVTRLEKDPKRLYALYQAGIRDCKAALPQIRALF